MSSMHLDSDGGVTVAPANKLSIILFACVYVFNILETATIDSIYIWTLRVLSGISVALLIYINFNKALEIHRAKKEKKKADGNS